MSAGDDTHDRALRCLLQVMTLATHRDRCAALAADHHVAAPPDAIQAVARAILALASVRPDSRTGEPSR